MELRGVTRRWSELANNVCNIFYLSVISTAIVIKWRRRADDSGTTQKVGSIENKMMEQSTKNYNE